MSGNCASAFPQLFTSIIKAGFSLFEHDILCLTKTFNENLCSKRVNIDFQNVNIAIKFVFDLVLLGMILNPEV